MTATSKQWFDIDRKGLAQIIERRGKAFALTELLQNALDEDGVTTIDITLNVTGKGTALLVVEDDAPDGFADLTHAYTLFAPSAKKSQAEKRGRFNLGEKLVLALCKAATVQSTTGGVAFDEDGTRKALRTKRERGSVFTGTVYMTKREVEEAIAVVRSCLIPEGFTVLLNGGKISPRVPVHTFTATLPTELSDEDGTLRRTRRKTTVNLYEPLPGERASIYEMGIPVVDTGDQWHYDVGQKVPLSIERDNVTPAYLRELRVAVANAMADSITSANANEAWVRDSLKDPKIRDEAVVAAVKARFGEKAVAFDPSDQEANNLAVSRGYAIVGGRSLSKEEWANVKRAGALLPAGKVTPSNSSVEMRVASGDEDTNEVPVTNDQMAAFKDYAIRLARDLLGTEIDVTFHKSLNDNINGHWVAAYSRGHLRINTVHWSKAKYAKQHWVDEVLLHEFAHHYASNHLDHSFHDALCRLGARLRDSEQRL